ncbi:aconitase X [Desulforhopalus singaporensis]|uniref:Predicted aconitase subunit 1 n=1 Tax=Desulforhopalus singaporensis TaxID=91360 RepID=A0A1H0RML1_9BACT|nr:aconitase X catalytic domain-containing protein [Desulforhopalus singaporensis]SDP30744.1 predicted aconitase subunit 1 [Desulforhopalus singaporensis]
MKLTSDEQDTLQGNHGEAARLAMAVIVDIGELFGAEELIPVSQAHIDTTIYMVDAGVEFVEKLCELGARFSIPTQLNPSAVDLQRPEKLRADGEILEKSRRLERAYLKMGAIPTWTCAPYQQGLVPMFGEQIAWGESNAIAFANSILGARTNRYADLMDICVAIIGKAPGFGLHLTRNRKAQLLVKLADIGSDRFRDKTLFPLLGFVFGELAGDRIGALEGMPKDVEVDDLKAFSAAAASSGAVGLFHIIGVTPEAQTREMAFQGEAPEKTLEITSQMIQNAEDRLRTTNGREADLISLGCPHYSAVQFSRLRDCFAGRKVHDSVSFWVNTSRSVYSWIENSGVLQELEQAGVTVFVDGCPLQYPKKNWNFTVAMSDSAKFANYCFSQTGLEVAFGSMADCVETAVYGKIIRRGLSWQQS